jgi:hypothetical protein
MARHSNGGGLVEDEAEARPTAYIDINSKVTGRSRAHSGRLISSTLAIEARFHNATAEHSMIACDEVTGGYIRESCLLDQSVVWDAPLLYRVTMRDGARVYGNARLFGPMKLFGDMRVAAGTWHRAPRYTHLGFCFITEGPPGWVLVDCKFAPYARWFRVGDRFARRWYKWTPEMLAKVREVLTEWGSDYVPGVHWGRCIPACSNRIIDYPSDSSGHS